MTGNAHEVCSCKLLTISFFALLKEINIKINIPFFLFLYSWDDCLPAVVVSQIHSTSKIKECYIFKKNYSEGRTIHALDKC